MPRKFQQPAKRRKSRSTTIPYDFEGDAPAASPADDEGPLDEEAPLLAVDVADPEPEAEDRPMRHLSSHAKAARHVSRDYAYVRGELVRIAAIATFLVVSLAITSVLR